MNKSEPIQAQPPASFCPDGWRIVPLSSLCKLQRGFDLTQATSEPGTVPVYSSSGVSYFTKDSKVRPPAIVTGRKGLLGQVYLPSEPFWPHDTTLWGNQFGSNSPRFVAYALGAFGLEKLDAATSVPTLNRNNLHAHEIAIPEHAEQEAIAEALSDADALIEGLERLIAKKRLIKQGAMQDLLTAKRRLPGFSGEWGETSLGNFGTTYGGLSGKSKQDFGHGDGRYVEFLDVLTNEVVPKREFPRVCIANTERQNHVRRGDLLFNGSSETPEEVGLCAEVPFETDDLYLNSFCFGFRPLPGANFVPRFMALLIRSGVGRSRIKHLAQGATRYNLSKRRLLELQLPIPRFDEQAEIALVSADMDAEIQALEARLEKARQVKEGMMQNLLTGRIRLV
ncbi:restriction endonuclease subunit S [Roseovarius sp. ZX-A-9]|uniref:restriction endonuclease subunit S n=1 Tax=Roseovarius sp. ZX-A-9 TaxID=3014783 RepID=UPI002330E4C1|nr:restriction endonuclease subunit S [Roseovarius sp. ZX-A-9]